MQTVKEAVEEFLEQANRRFSAGDVMVLPDRDQIMVIEKVLYFKDGKSLRVLLLWSSDCVVCGDKYTFKTRRKFSYPTRTCRGCRGRAAAIEKEKPPKEPVKRKPKIGRGERAVLEAIEALGFVYDRCTERVVAKEAAKRLKAPAPGSRDQRFYNSQRALANLRRRGLLPAAIHEGEVVFI